MNLKYVAILLVITIALTAAITKYYFPNNTETTKEVVRNDIRTIVKEITRPDGSKETVTETTDKSTKKESHNAVIVKPQWLVGISAKTSLKDPEIGYELSVAKRQLGPIYLMGQVGYRKSETTLGLGLMLEY
jgi:hypothetical protein